MALKKILTTAPPRELESLYKKDGERWVLDVEDDGDGDKIKEFRNENIRLRQQIEAQGQELAAIKGLLEKLSPQASEKKEPETLTAKVEGLTKLVESERQARLEAEKSARRAEWERSFVEAASKAKVRDGTAAKVLLALAQQTFREDEKTGTFVARDEKGLPLFGPNSTNPLTVDEWIEEQKAGAYKDLFAQPQGGTARGSGNPFLGGTPPKKMVPQTEAGKYIDEIAKGEVGVEVPK